MPPWVAAAPQLSSLTYGRAIERIPIALRCRHAPKASFTHLRVRAASTHVSPTVINLRPDIPARNKELHEALSTLGGVAERYVNESRLQLALEGLAAQDPVTRVAVLSLHSQGYAHRLAQLLLADPLGAEEPWEKELVKAGKEGEKPVLLKFGQDADSNPSAPSHKVLSIPSRVLRTHNLEILVSALQDSDVAIGLPAQVDGPMDAMLVPRLRGASQRMLPQDGVPCPVHKTLVLGKGLDGAVDFGRYTSNVSNDLHEFVKLAITVPPPSGEKDLESQGDAVAVSTQVGVEALATFRESIQNSIAYERGWFRSGLPPLSAWLTHDLEPSAPIKPVLKKLVASIANDTHSNIFKADGAQLAKLAKLPTAEATFASVVNHLETWAEKSHTELRDELDDAFSARNWHKLAWWKLLWRVDDVTMISSEILERRWLVSAEKSSIYLAGRMNQAGFPDEIQPLAARDMPEVVHVTTEETAPTASNPPPSRVDISTEVHKSIPWPEHIAASRTELINDTVPPLQALAQSLILQTFSTTALSSAASALLYVTMSSLSVFEAAAVGVLGLTISLRRMQKAWEEAREMWEGTVREDGRTTLKGTEETVRMIIEAKAREDAGLGVVEDESARERREAMEAVEKVRKALEKLESGKTKDV